MGAFVVRLNVHEPQTSTPTATLIPTPTEVSTPGPTKTLTPTPTSASKPWTFLLYLDGDNNLYSYLDRAIRNLEALPANPNVNVVILFDGDRNDDSRRFLVQPGGNYSIGVNKWYVGELNMGTPQTLSDFIIWSRDRYPAAHYYLSIADHGRGITGIAWDDTNSRDYLTVREIQTALNTATASGQFKLDVVHYDACLMAMLENAYQIRQYADHLVASQNLGWSVFAYDQYTKAGDAEAQCWDLLGHASVAARVTADTTPQQLAISVTDAYFNHPGLAAYPRTISALDLGRAATVRDAVNSLAAALHSGLAETKNYVRNSRDATQKFDSRDYYKITNEDEYLDLYDFARRIKLWVPNATAQSAAQEVMDAILGGFVVAEHHESKSFDFAGTELHWNVDNAHGVAIYFPPAPGGNGYGDYVNNVLFSFTADSQWDEFLVDYYGVMGLPPESPTDPGLPPFLQPVSKLFLPFVTQRVSGIQAFGALPCSRQVNGGLAPLRRIFRKEVEE